MSLETLQTLVKSRPRLSASLSVTTLILVILSRWFRSPPFAPLLYVLLGIGKPKVPIEGSVERGYEKVREAFGRGFEVGDEVGSGLVVYVKGKEVVNLYGGYTDTKRTKPYTQSTINIVFSSGKAVASILIAHLVDRGLLDYDEKIATYWPEFAEGGKADVRLRDLMGHRAGVGFLDKERVPTAEQVTKLDELAGLIAGQPHNFDGEAVQAYHAVTRGWYLNEIVRRVTGGKTMGEILKTEIAPKLNIDFYYGLPESEEPRVAHMVPYPHLKGISKFIVPQWLQETPPPIMMLNALRDPKKILMRSFESAPKVSKDEDKSAPNGFWANARSIRAAEGSSYCSVGNARALARFAALMANNGTLDGVTLIKPETMEKAFTTLTPSQRDLALWEDTRTTIGGFGQFGGIPEFEDVEFHGWGGLGGSLILWNREKNIAVGYAMNGMHQDTFWHIKRTHRLLGAIHECLKKQGVV